eukprot:206101_1
MPKRKKQRRNQRKKRKPQHKQTKSSNNKNESKQHQQNKMNDCEGYLTLTDNNTNESNFWATLCGPILTVYNARNKKKVIRIIQLCDYKNISVNKFKYHFEITNNQTTLNFAFKTNNARHEWLTHIDYIINNSQNEETQNDDIKNNAFNSDESTKFLQSALKIYEQWDNNKNEHGSLEIFLRKTLNASYVTILNHFHCIIVNSQKSAKNKSNISYQCSFSGDTECKYIKRRNVTEKRTLNDNDDEKKADEDNIKSCDVLWCQLLDKVHCYFFHSDNTESIRCNASDKFVIETKNDIDAYEIKDEIKNEHKDHNEAMFAFGLSFDYYNDKFSNYTNAYYLYLKEELISNPYYKLTVNKYYNIYQQALQIIKSKQFENMKANNNGIWNSITGIAINARITINHIISLLIYCNETEIQKIFKQHTRKSKNSESYSNAIKRQSFIAHWTRYLYESLLF